MNPTYLIAISCVAGFFALFILFTVTRHWLKSRRLLYVLRGLNADQVAALKQSNIPLNQAGADFVSTQYKHLGKACKLLGVSILALTQKENGTREAFLRCLPKKKSERFALSIDNHGSGSRLNLLEKYRSNKIARLVIDYLAPVIGNKVVVHVYPGRTLAPRNDNYLNVYLHNAPAGGGRQRSPERLFGYAADERESFASTAGGITIREPDSGFAVAELHNNNLYLLVNPRNEKRGSWNPALVLSILEQAIPEINYKAHLASLVDSSRQEAKTSGATAYPTSYACQRERRREVVETLVGQLISPLVGSPIRVIEQAPHKNAVLNRSPGEFHVYLNGQAEGKPVIPTVETLLGQKLTARAIPVAPSPDSWSITDEQGVVFAEIKDRNLMLLLPFLTECGNAESDLLARVLLKIAQQLPEALSAGKNEFNKHAEQDFVAECMREVSKYRNWQGKPVALNKAKQAFTDSLRQTLQQQNNLEKMQTCPVDELGEEYDQILTLANVKDVRVEGDKLVVSTDTLYCRNPRSGERHEIGAFLINIHVGSNKIQWFNQTRTVRNMNAPHVDNSGNACMGNTKELFPQLIAKRQYASAIQLAIVFVESVNLDDSWGKHLVEWPVR